MATSCKSAARHPKRIGVRMKTSTKRMNVRMKQRMP